MSEGVFLVNEKSGRKFQVLGFNKEKGEITLMGEMKRPFAEKYDKEALEKQGYVMKKLPIMETADA